MQAQYWVTRELHMHREHIFPLVSKEEKALQVCSNQFLIPHCDSFHDWQKKVKNRPFLPFFKAEDITLMGHYWEWQQNHNNNTYSASICEFHMNILCIYNPLFRLYSMMDCQNTLISEVIFVITLVYVIAFVAELCLCLGLILPPPSLILNNPIIAVQ